MEPSLVVAEPCCWRPKLELDEKSGAAPTGPRGAAAAPMETAVESVMVPSGVAELIKPPLLIDGAWPPPPRGCDCITDGCGLGIHGVVGPECALPGMVTGGLHKGPLVVAAEPQLVPLLATEVEVEEVLPKLMLWSRWARTAEVLSQLGVDAWSPCCCVRSTCTGLRVVEDVDDVMDDVMDDDDDDEEEECECECECETLAGEE